MFVNKLFFMNTNDFSSFIMSPQNLDKNTLHKVKEITGQFPYCQIAHVLYIKNLSNINDNSYSSYLGIAASYAGSRKRLFSLIHDKISKETQQSESFASAAIDVKKTDITPEVSTQKSENIINVEEKPLIREEIKTEEIKPKDTVEISKSTPPVTPLSDADKKAEFQRQLKLRLAEIAKESNQTEGEKQKSNELIDKFIKEEPKISSPKSENSENKDLAEKSSTDNSEIISETLAQIYEKQGNFKKAIETYEKLSLKYPEKNTYFAAQIENIKNNSQYLNSEK